MDQHHYDPKQAVVETVILSLQARPNSLPSPQLKPDEPL